LVAGPRWAPDTGQTGRLIVGRNVSSIIISLVKALCYKLEGRGFDTRRGTFFLMYLILPVALGPVVYSASNRNEYQKHKNNNVSGAV
jgi:hypothetical protein